MTDNRFRFRAWNKIKKILHYEAEKGLFDLPFHILCKSDEFIIEQCTGLKDRNGKLIYEGDICTYWVEGDFNREVLVKIGFDKKSCYWYINDEWRYKSSFYCSNIATLKIIGNIHENPELLEGKNERKPRFKIGQDIWFRYKQNRPAPVSVLGYGKKPKTYDICSLEGVFILQDVEEQYLYATEEEARNGIY